MLDYGRQIDIWWGVFKEAAQGLDIGGKAWTLPRLISTRYFVRLDLLNFAYFVELLECLIV